MRLDLVTFARATGLFDAFVNLVDRCLDDYDLSGWRSGPWVWEPKPLQGGSA